MSGHQSFVLLKYLLATSVRRVSDTFVVFFRWNTVKGRSKICCPWLMQETCQTRTDLMRVQTEGCTGAYLLMVLLVSLTANFLTNYPASSWFLLGAGMAQWWECLPPTIVSRVRFPDPASYVGWVCCWFSTLLWEVFLWVLRVTPLFKNQYFQIPVRSWNAQAFLNKFLYLLGAPGVKKLHIYIHLFLIFFIGGWQTEGAWRCEYIHRLCSGI